VPEVGGAVLRLDFPRSLLEYQVLQYQLSGPEAVGKGPLVVLLDKSGSLDGPRHISAAALALTLLDHDRHHRRTLALLGFDAGVKFEAIVKAEELIPEDGLLVSCCGKAEIAVALERGLGIVRTHPGTLKKADIVLVRTGAPIRPRHRSFGSRPPSSVSPSSVLTSAQRVFGSSLVRRASRRLHPLDCRGRYRRAHLRCLSMRSNSNCLRP